MIPEVEFLPAEVALCDDEAVARVRQAAAESPRKRARLCLHADAAATLHEMLIALRRGTEIPIHRHPGKAECYHVIAGEFTLRIVDDRGAPLRDVPMGPPGSGRVFLCRIAAGLWHTVEVESDEVLLHESTSGPLIPGDTEYLSGKD